MTQPIALTIPELKTNRLILRGPRMSDFEDSFWLWSHPETVRYIGGTPSTRQQAWFRFLRQTAMWVHMGFGSWVVRTLKDDTFVGELGFGAFKRGFSNDFDHMPEAGWVISPNVHGKGYGREAVEAVHCWMDAQAFGQDGTVCMIDVGNTASERIAERLGYDVTAETLYEGAEVRLYKREPA